MKRTKLAALLAVPFALGAVLWPVARDNRRRALAQASTEALWREVSKDEPQLDVVSALISSGANVNARDRYKRTSLRLLVTNGWFKLHQQNVVALRLLLDSGADPNEAEPGDTTDLMMVSACPQPEAVRLMLSAKADVNARNSEGETALSWVRDQIYDYTYRYQDLESKKPLPFFRENERLLQAAGAKP